jgi:hypothetical protein
MATDTKCAICKTNKLTPDRRKICKECTDEIFLLHTCTECKKLCTKLYPCTDCNKSRYCYSCYTKIHYCSICNTTQYYILNDNYVEIDKPTIKIIANKR